ncbi:MAG: hypothetical protein HYW47_07655 [Deltaproteobacteria bacterium]|nr:hypothetical protein [Deltaproteobacteria bacterium]
MLEKHLLEFSNKTSSESCGILTLEGHVVKIINQLENQDSLNTLFASQIAAIQNTIQILKSSLPQAVFIEGDLNIFFSTLDDKYFIFSLHPKNIYTGKVLFEFKKIKENLIKELTQSHFNTDLSLYSEELMFEEIKDEEIERLFEF